MGILYRCDCGRIYNNPQDAAMCGETFEQIETEEEDVPMRVKLIEMKEVLPDSDEYIRIYKHPGVRHIFNPTEETGRISIEDITIHVTNTPSGRKAVAVSMEIQELLDWHLDALKESLQREHKDNINLRRVNEHLLRYERLSFWQRFKFLFTNEV